MKKSIFLSSLLLLSINAYALDISTSDNRDHNYKEDKSIGYKKDVNLSDSKEKSKSQTYTKEKAVSESEDLKKIAQTDPLVGLMAMEYAGIEPFKTCGVLTKPKLANDLGLGCRTKSGLINSNKCSALEEAAKSNFPIDDITYKSDEIRQYAACVGLYGAIIAQDMKTGEFNVEVKDKQLKKMYVDFAETLDTSDCRLNGTLTSIVCGATTIKIDANPSITFASISLYSNDSYFGFSSSISESKSKRVSDSYSDSKSKKKSEANSMAKSLNINKSTGTSLTVNAAANLSMSKFLPAE